MDTSEQYIKMCDTPEIQEEHDITPEDFLGSPNGPFAESIWLPRQDQLQEMVGSDMGELYHIFWKNMSVVSSYERTPYTDKCTSMEQLWLAFVMKEKYNKTWDGDKWIKGI